MILVMVKSNYKLTSWYGSASSACYNHLIHASVPGIWPCLLCSKPHPGHVIFYVEIKSVLLLSPQSVELVDPQSQIIRVTSRLTQTSTNPLPTRRLSLCKQHRKSPSFTPRKKPQPPNRRQPPISTSLSPMLSNEIPKRPNALLISLLLIIYLIKVQNVIKFASLDN